jgi:uncharacterized small protein (DUF1192 family)
MDKIDESCQKIVDLKAEIRRLEAEKQIAELRLQIAKLESEIAMLKQEAISWQPYHITYTTNNCNGTGCKP